MPRLSRDFVLPELYEALYRDAAIGIAVVSKSRDFLKANPFFCRMLGYTELELQEMNVNDITHPDDMPENIRKDDAVIDRRIDHFTYEKRYIRKDGTVFWVLLTATLYRAKSNEEVFIAQVQDISAQKELERIRLERQVEERTAELKLKNKELALASKYKSEFVSNISHELRNPLNGILILTKLLLEKNHHLHREDLESVRVIHSAGVELLNLINSVLDLAKIESGKMTLHLSEISLRELAKRVHRKFAPQAKEKSLLFSVDVDSDVPDLMHSDDQKMEQLLNNFLSNAFKFTERGEVRVRFSMGKRMDGKELLFIQVRDTGIGISKENQNLIFESFQQEDGSTARKFGGTGLGLAISSKLCQLLGGDIGLESQKGVGTCFTVHLPTLAKAQIEKEAECNGHYVEIVSSQSKQGSPIKIETTKSLSLKDKKILIAEDDKRNQYSLKRILSPMEAHLIFATNGIEAVEKVKKFQPHLVVMDMMMPEMDGYEAIQSIRSMSDFRRLPIISLTASALNNARERCLRAGASDYVKKPIEIDRFLNCLSYWLAHA